MAKATRRNNAVPAPQKRTWDEILIDMATRFGIGGAAILSSMFILICYGTKSQHEEFIDRYILWKLPKEYLIFPFYIIYILGFLLIAVILYFRKRLALKDEKIATLEKDKEFLQRTLLDK
jgi:hypothetical protein